ncbi:branched-chain amino acid transport system permease protein [Azospirillum lipoferum]|uniref:ATP-binding cassette domain-containing protein n=1 Tax=Azospirillum lipoferum TaxID=193 RepID=A0A5A9GK71_AZOLI|nr:MULTISPECIES: ATP-binding cassette domain-containing protein [Azospirillum]KAA0594723.1 ATP-binding cassette domain-containing protein [Azospirillum lipoferum]MCP1612966.1 branched-chain amino acid transport system permease protein [Azospirillum lipoferum]MDW5532844.1 ATP-binding cassette domain-containing protein [Azospirillum sp. NL1]
MAERSSPRVPLIAGALALLVYALAFASPYGLRVLTVAGVYALATFGFQIVFGLGGALSLAQGAFCGVGAYVTGILGSRYGLGFEATFPLSMLVPLLLALPVGLAVLRLESHYFALATLGIAQVLHLLAVNLPDLTGGSNGLAGVPAVVLFGWVVPRGLPMAGLVWGLVALGGLIGWRLARGRLGRSLTMLRDDPLAAGTLGLDVGRLRLTAFGISALFAGAAGALAVHTQRVVSPEVLEFPVMVSILTIAIVGGRGRMAGAVLGAVLLLHLPEWFRFLERGYLVVYGVALLATVVLAPDGLTGLLDRIAVCLFGRRQRTPVETREPPLPLDLPDGMTVEGLRKSFGGVLAVDDVSLDLRPGTITGLIGPNGSGKSTVINLLSGLERPDAGRVQLGGREVTGARADRLARAGLARSFQAAALPAGAGVLEAVAAARLAFDPDAKTAEAHAGWALGRLGIGELAAHSCDGLPAALRRRVELARALVRRPVVLLLDEPAAGLTDGEKADLAALLRDLAGEGMAILLVEHDMGFLLPLAGRVLCLDRGRVIYDGPAGGVRHDPVVAAAYLGRVASA